MPAIKQKRRSPWKVVEISFYYYPLRDMISNKPPTLHHRRCDDNAISYVVANTLLWGRVAKPYRQFLKNFCFRADDWSSNTHHSSHTILPNMALNLISHNIILCIMHRNNYIKRAFFPWNTTFLGVLQCSFEETQLWEAIANCGHSSTGFGSLYGGHHSFSFNWLLCFAISTIR